MKHFICRLMEAQTVEQTPAQSTNFLEMMDLFILFMIVACGAYCVYTFIRLKRECMLFESKILYPGNCSYLECIDPDGFIDYIQYRILILGIFLLLCGGVSALDTYVIKIQQLWLSLTLTLLPVAGLAWFAVIQRKAAKRFW